MKFKFLRKYEEYSDVFSYYSSTELLYVIFLSYYRYDFLFSVLYFLHFFQVDISLIESLTIVRWSS